MQFPDEVTDDLTKRLRRIEGQVRGLQTMLAEDRDCADVVTQIAAVSKALDRVGLKLIASGLTYCVANPREASASGYDLARVEKLFLQLT
jgi:DNA-binding FrmR family transcriptional regulator